MIVKVHSTPNGKLLAICDSDLLGKVFEEGERQLDLSGLFYQGKEASDEELARLLKDCYVINAVGKCSVGFLIKNQRVDKGNVLEISGIPYAQCVVDQ